MKESTEWAEREREANQETNSELQRTNQRWPEGRKAGGMGNRVTGPQEGTRREERGAIVGLLTGFTTTETNITLRVNCTEIKIQY